MDNDIMIVSKNAGAPVPFSITAKDADRRIVASGDSALMPLRRKCI